MIQATARVLKNIVDIQVGEESWIGRPKESGEAGLGRRIAALFSTDYLVFRAEAPEEVHSTVSYRSKTDEIRIQIGEQHWHTHSTTFGPMTIEYGAVLLTINERLTGRFAVLRGKEPVAVGQLGFRSCTIRDYPPDLEVFFGNLALGYVIRTLSWEGFGSVTSFGR
jgi:hypothetical protein